MSQLSLLFKDRILSIHQLNQHDEFIIGSNPACNIHIDSLAVNPKHARLVFDNHKYTIEPLDNDCRILINNRLVEAPSALSDGDHINIGKHTLIFSFDERNEKHQVSEPVQTRVTEQGTGWIQFLNGSNMGKTIHIKKGMTNISDDEENNVAMISNRGDGYYISYLKGQSPQVNNKNIGENSVKLESNAKIILGSQQLLFYIE